METLTTTQFNQLYNQYHASVQRFVLFKTGDRYVAEEVSAKVFTKIYGRVNKMKVEGDMKSYIFGAVRNGIIDFYRSHSRGRDFWISQEERHSDFSSLETPFTDICKQQRCLYVREVVDMLPPAQKELVDLFYFQELSLNEIEEKLNLPLGTIKNRLFKAKRQLAKWINRKNL